MSRRAGLRNATEEALQPKVGDGTLVDASRKKSLLDKAFEEAMWLLAIEPTIEFVRNEGEAGVDIE